MGFLNTQNQQLKKTAILSIPVLTSQRYYPQSPVLHSSVPNQKKGEAANIVALPSGDFENN